MNILDLFSILMEKKHSVFHYYDVGYSPLFNMLHFDIKYSLARESSGPLVFTYNSQLHADSHTILISTI